MKITLFMAISVNGYVAGKNDDTDWVKDTQILYDLVAEKGVCVMGRRTYEDCMKYNVFPYKNALNIVVTHDQSLISKTSKDIIFTDQTIEEIIKIVSDRNLNEIIVMGGGNINSHFLKNKSIDEIVVDIHPIVLSGGIRLFEDVFPDVTLELIDTHSLNDGIVQIKYRVAGK